MPARLPPDVSLADFERQAKSLATGVAAADPAALALVGAHHPRGAAAVSAFAVSDARLVVARAAGAPSWPRLKRDLEVVARYTWRPPAAPRDEIPGERPEDTWMRRACGAAGAWDAAGMVAAAAALDADPGLPGVGLHGAAVAGDAARVGMLLDARPTAATSRGGPYGWEPLLYVCHARLRRGDPVAVVRRLLAAGADPNAGYLPDASPPPVTALAAVLGSGPGGCPPHPQADALVDLLLTAGADANDARALAAGPGEAVLHQMVAHGLGGPPRGPWFERLAERVDPPETLLADALAAAEAAGATGRVALLRAARTRRSSAHGP